MCLKKDQTFTMGILLFCMFALERLVCRHVLFIPFSFLFVGMYMSTIRDLFVTFGQCTSILTEIKVE